MTGSLVPAEHLSRIRPGLSDTATSGGSSDTGQNALTVTPTSSRPSATVTSVTPATHESSAPRQREAADRGPFGQLMSQDPGSISGPYGGKPARAASRQAGPQAE